jgi:hypothetical protein
MNQGFRLDLLMWGLLERVMNSSRTERGFGNLNSLEKAWIGMVSWWLGTT